MYRSYQKALEARILAVLARVYQMELPAFASEQPPKVELGEFALTTFELAKRLKKAPRKIAEELIAELGQVEGFASFEIAGAGYVNAKLDRVAAARSIAAHTEGLPARIDFPLIEHTSINPNKAAHIGHLRNAILGDTLARMMRVGPDDSTFNNIGVQNYIDNTGVQVADVVVALTHLQGLNLDGVQRWMADLAAREERIDYACWDLYAHVSQWYEAEPEQKEARKKIRLDTLHTLEQGGNETATIADLVATAIVRRHLETMQRLGIEYDFLPRESEVLQLKFWDAAFAMMKEKGVLYKETAGKNAGCWVMRRAGTAGITDNGPDEEAKIIVRSNKQNPAADGPVTYVGKDIAYHLWKFNKLGLDFGYEEFYAYADREAPCWISKVEKKANGPHFGHADAVYNVIDSRQADPQNNVIEALRGMGFAKEADNYHHFSYEMVALTPRCAVELGYVVSEEDQSRAFIEVSGRKGFGVKADDLIDKLIEAAKVEVDARHPELDDEARRSIATKIAVGALRYYMLRYTRNTIIAFDFKDALSFEGETGPYAQYAVVRAANIFRKAEQNNEPLLQEARTIADQMTSTFMKSIFGTPNIEETICKAYSQGHWDVQNYFNGEEGDSVWEVWLAASKSIVTLETSIRTTEPAYLAKYVFQLAQQFNNFYHRHHILTESDPARKALLLATAAVAHRELTRALGWLGIDVPAVM